jgi:acetylglutamate kinase
VPAPGSLLVVHGGGDEVSTLQRLYGVEARFAGGRRVTSALDLEIIRMALSGSANKRLVSALIDAGVSAIGLSGEDGALLTADPLDPDAVRSRGHARRGERRAAAAASRRGPSACDLARESARPTSAGRHAQL